MKNIHEILKGIGIEVPEDKKEAFDKAVLENYKTVNEVEVVREKLATAEKERDTIKEKYDKHSSLRQVRARRSSQVYSRALQKLRRSTILTKLIGKSS